MKRLDDLRAAIKQQIDAVMEGARILVGISQPREVAVAPAQVRCSFCRQVVTPTATTCPSCRRKLVPSE